MFSYEAAGAMERANRIFENAERQNAEWAAYARQLKARIAQLELEVISKTAAVEGAQAIIDGFKIASPDSPMFAKTKHSYSDKGRVGELKTVARIVWERAHDAFLKARGIDPLQHRTD